MGREIRRVPLSPVFPTREGMIDWLVNDGDRMGIGGRVYRMSREAAERFVDGAYAPSMVVQPGKEPQSGLTMLEPQ